MRWGLYLGFVVLGLGFALFVLEMGIGNNGDRMFDGGVGSQLVGTVIEGEAVGEDQGEGVTGSSVDSFSEGFSEGFSDSISESSAESFAESYSDSFADSLVAAAQERTLHRVVYDGSYQSLDYPGGDVADDRGVCTDLIIRSYRALGIDLQQVVHRDMVISILVRYLMLNIPEWI